MSGRTKKAVVRQKSQRRKALASTCEVTANELVIAEDLVQAGVSKEVVEKYLNKIIYKELV